MKRAPWQWRRVASRAFTRAQRLLLVALSAALMGFGGGLGTLGGKPRKVEKADADNPIVCVAEASQQKNV